MNKSTLKTLSLCVLLATVPLTGCTALAIGGVAAGGLAITDRRTVGAQTDDQTMEMAIKSQSMSYFKQQGSANSTVSATSYNRNILITGVVANEEEKQAIDRLARAQASVREVYNYIDVGTAYTMSVKDSWITSKVRTVLLNPKGYSPTHIKVVTYNGVTYVMGILTPAEQNAVNHEISTTTGVQKVVTLYETFEQ
ncbi:MAG: BON domain-containing protein [Neisseriaceae bacterium]|nr:BON domain-containing protein [Neisseriaceae bacterium]